MQPNKSISLSDHLFGGQAEGTMFFIKIRANSKLISAVLLLESQSWFQGWNWRFDEKTRINMEVQLLQQDKSLFMKYGRGN